MEEDVVEQLFPVPVVGVSVPLVVARHDVQHDGEREARVGPEEIGRTREAAAHRRKHPSSGST